VPFERQLAPEAVRDIAASHVAGKTNRVIGAEYGKSHTTIGRLLKQPDVAAEVERLRAEINAAENKQADAVRRERERKQAAVRQANKRTRDSRKKLGIDPSGDPTASRRRLTSGDGRVLGVFSIPNRGAPFGTLDDESSAQRMNRLERELVLQVMSDIAILTADGSTSYDRLDAADRERAANFVEHYAGGNPFETREELLAALEDARSTIDLSVDADDLSVLQR